MVKKIGGTLTLHIWIRVPFDFLPQAFLLGCLLLNFVFLNNVLSWEKNRILINSYRIWSRKKSISSFCDLTPTLLHQHVPLRSEKYVDNLVNTDFMTDLLPSVDTKLYFCCARISVRYSSGYHKSPLFLALIKYCILGNGAHQCEASWVKIAFFLGKYLFSWKPLTGGFYTSYARYILQGN